MRVAGMEESAKFGSEGRMLYATVSEILALRSQLPVIWKHPPRGLGQRYVAIRLFLLSAARAGCVDSHIDERAVRGCL